ncbi:MAG: hypothetical protein COV07_02980 [Candidatus Vogelbacteria bacterium CG10_big_fil_rev_8_21_14_0_10_45_14]|uniref:Penicillin-binding protein transpeptidase domain-containing protein n=1 Tax=Candidatus Vogelbacteria bacterium CG10_big_fil_rev_8_21_14_0_10_45_14 TaxID=1975042 RepID=A0A2H0RJN6_9BACT|nr:MAG: hypothetical protein COV07_02980 [Candidatus Vogelbacteria bacterium CG10_big_fil_rev_8_21_14_0_10_45_14]
MSTPKKEQSFRLRLLAGVVVLLALLYSGRLFDLQIVNGESYTEDGNRQYVSPGTAGFDRGSIYFTERKGNIVSAATLKSVYFVSTDPSKGEDPTSLYKAINAYLNESDRKELLNKLSEKNDTYEVIANSISKESADAISELKLKNIRVHRRAERNYPGGNLASHVLGFVGQDETTGDNFIGQAGVEKYYEDILQRGEDRLYVNFFAELFGNISSVIFEKGREREGDVVLTIEPAVELELERVLALIMEKYDSTEAGGIVLDPRSGEVLGMAALPNFDPAKYHDAQISSFRNPLVQSVFELGSIVKPLTMAAALDAGVVSPESTYNDRGSLEISGYTISNYDGKARGVVDMQEILNQSLNTGAVYLSEKLGASRFERYMQNYGFGELTGIELPGESIGLTSTLNRSRPVELATASFGQGFAVSPITMARALASLGNGGLLIAPHVTKQIIYPLYGREKIEKKVVRRVLDESTSIAVTRMLVEVVDTVLGGGKHKLENHTVAAKTGTAQMPQPGGGYYPDKYLHSFFGYMPAYDPKFLIFLYVKDPKGVRYASETLTDPFFDITNFLLHYYEVPPDR